MIDTFASDSEGVRGNAFLYFLTPNPLPRSLFGQGGDPEMSVPSGGSVVFLTVRTLSSLETHAGLGPGLAIYCKLLVKPAKALGPCRLVILHFGSFKAFLHWFPE